MDSIAPGEHGSQAQDQNGVNAEGVLQVLGQHEALQGEPEARSVFSQLFKIKPFQGQIRGSSF